MNQKIEVPLGISNRIVGGGEVGWAWWLEGQQKMAVIGNERLSPRRNLVAEIAKQIHMRDKNAVYWISTEKPPVSEVKLMDGILWTEQYPDPPEQLEMTDGEQTYLIPVKDREVFIETRKFFSSSYLNLLAMSLGINRSDLMPPSSYRQHMEGPLMGYKRVIDDLESDHPYKQRLEDEVSLLTSVKWFKTLNEGTRYHLQTEGDLYSQALSFLKAVWSFWAFICQQEAQQQMLLIIDPPKELLRFNIDKEIEKVMYEAFRILTNISHEATVTLLLSSEMFYPAAEMNFRHKIFFQTEDSDLDLKSPAIKNQIDPVLFKEWEQGNKCVGLWVDDAQDDSLNNAIVAQFKETGIEFWDDFSNDDSSENQ